MRIGEMLGDYKLLEIIGKGGQGIVYKALDTKLKRPVAVKIFTADGEHRRQKLASFKYEARLASSLNHPNICAVYGLFENDEHTCIVMEYVEGKNLFELAYQKPLAVKSALKIIIQVTRGLIAAHEQGIVHRDIKPRNVMVTKDGRVVVLDFGLAKLLKNGDEFFSSDASGTVPTDKKGESFYEDIAEDLFITIEGMPLGTPASSAPEMALGKPADYRADVYSTGSLLYLLLTGTYPFLAKTIREVRDKVINEEQIPVSVARTANGVLPPGLMAIVRRALRKNPDERFQSMIEMREALIAVLGELKKDANGNKENSFSVFSETGEPRYASPSPVKSPRRSLIFLTAALILAALLVVCFLLAA